MARPWARFDDLRAGTALLCPPPSRILTAVRPDEVAGVLQQVHDATRGGQLGLRVRGVRGGRRPGPAAAGRPVLPRGAAPGLVRAVRRTGPGGSGDAPGRRRAAARAVAPGLDRRRARPAVARVREHIAAGETYQCNLTDRLRATVAGDPEDLYARLALAQRGAYNAYLDLGRHVVASASPELFFEWAGDVVRTRPMKGTAPRGRTTAEDREQSRLLRSSSKEQAENLMIVDLLRNDLGRVAEIGSVVVDELFALERYPTVWQMTSQVSARVRPGTGLLDLFRALFPCGSVTGAPKRRTMQLIDELEPTPRGVYCGAVGLVAPPSRPFRARFNVAIRTAVVDRTTGEAVYGAGGGITWGSEAAAGTGGAARQGGRPRPRRDRAPAPGDAGVRARRGAAQPRPPPRPHGRLGRLGRLPVRPGRRRRRRAAGGRRTERAGPGADPAVPGRGRRRRAAGHAAGRHPAGAPRRWTTTRWTPPTRGCSTRPPAATST